MILLSGLESLDLYFAVLYFAVFSTSLDCSK